eukprot:NODE_6319_length_899_cov_35.596649_g5727_i0.p1 GENE.NODE_6319_length_899_cov_35.596649_g5727_i0~~NODE_6319_length_899_cov_35.596649_g5727_i0.p1  ORF type:complete len:205 (+),score=50.77 NODE_6319_length_899_cov_35.596649_g5727_i0:64-678(+)
MPHLLCTVDMEGTLTPEVWPYVAQRTGIEELKLTTREFPSFEALMERRIAILKQHNIKLPQLLEIIEEIQPNKGAKEFLDNLRSKYELIIFTDTVDQIARVFMNKLGNPTCFANTLLVDPDGTITKCEMRLNDGKQKGVVALRSLNFTIISVGDSYNDSTMLQAANLGFWIHCPEKIAQEFPQFPAAESYDQLIQMIDEAVSKL